MFMFMFMFMVNISGFVFMFMILCEIVLNSRLYFIIAFYLLFAPNEIFKYQKVEPTTLHGSEWRYIFTKRYSVLLTLVMILDKTI